jgi:hypothetical protein
MSYEDNQSKTLVVTNPKIEIPKLINAIGHATIGLASKASSIESFQFLKYDFSPTAEWASASAISLFPYIVLEAKNNNQLKTLHRSVSEAGILHNVFTESMLGTSATEQMQQTLTANPDDLIYFCIVLFGTAEELTPLTRKFSLFKG